MLRTQVKDNPHNPVPSDPPPMPPPTPIADPGPDPDDDPLDDPEPDVPDWDNDDRPVDPDTGQPLDPFEPAEKDSGTVDDW
ncbi:hypothetical protein [Komagataeibacter swingsii]|uniref:Uncharacterized protein n=1 Tax=Komagataeibacter swingsii TaxID=215220 RepID=A0A2V4S627_9PROT|nr:hypothetical protein [Komagataeibacter swingsii]PYD70579.1 hypothetical protein CFR76_04280 [Komagataeibacter swingsii]GBQ59011.1 hypothetical protein AA16373_1438 [Komagataeibacter swingsii DSM 16373]